MKLTNQEIAEAISKHTFEKAYDHLNDNVKWNMVGGDDISGKEMVIDTLKESAKYLSTVTTTFDKFKVFVAGDTIVIDSSATYTDKDEQISIVSSCDIYEFNNDKLVEITSYNIELSPAA